MLQRVNQISFQQCLPAMLVQQCKALCVQLRTDIANHVVCNIACHSVQHCNNIETTLPQDCCYSGIMWGLQFCCSSVTILLIDISVQHCSNIAACQPNCVFAMSPSNVTVTVKNLMCSTLHWHCKSQCATLHCQHSHHVAVTLTSCEDCNIDAPCYNITNGYFCATLRQRCSVSTKLHLSNVSQQC